MELEISTDKNKRVFRGAKAWLLGLPILLLVMMILALLSLPVWLPLLLVVR